MVGTRSRVYSNNVVVPKRKYTKRKTVQSDPVQINEQSNEQTNEQSIEQVDPTNSIHLELDESLNNDNNDLTFDGFDRIVSRNRVISSEDEIAVEKTPKEYKNSLKGKKKAAVYEKIAGRSFKFETEAQIDTYIRTINQCNFKITNNNPVKCSIIDCNQTHKHKMKKVYLACNCKQASCNLKYRYQCCEYGGDWELYTIGNHPHIIDHVKEEYGLPLQIRVIFDDLLENDPDLKPNELLRIINKNRSKYVKLEKELSTQLHNDSNYIPTQRQKKINGAYLFDKKIIPDLSKIQTYMHKRTARNSENCLEKLKEMIMNHQFESSLPNEEPFIFNKIPRFDKEIKEKANKIEENQFKKSFSRSTRIVYTGYNDTKYIITVNDPNCSCSCSNFLKWAICHHVVAYSHCINKNWYGMKYNLLEKFARNTKKGAKPKRGRTGKINGALEYDSD